MDSSGSHNKPTSHPQKHHQPSNSEVLASAKLVAEAAKYAMSHESDKVDKAKVAGAAENLLAAASQYGNLEEKSFGKYVQQAESYLHQYHSSQSSSTTTNSSHSATGTTHSDSAPHSGGHDGNSGSGYGDYLKMAEGFFKKH